jgi:hypothetical protein
MKKGINYYFTYLLMIYYVPEEGESTGRVFNLNDLNKEQIKRIYKVENFRY